MLTPDESWRVLHSAERVLDASQVEAALARLAAGITAKLADSHPLVVSVMGGGLVFSGQLLPRLRFPLEFDYIHVTRYGDSTRGGEIDWKVLPRAVVRDRVVLVLDDILDEGHTLAAIHARLSADGAARVMSAVFAEKVTGRPKPIAADFVGVRLPDRYVFGFGMDVEGAWRNLPEVYALRQ